MHRPLIARLALFAATLAGTLSAHAADTSPPFYVKKAETTLLTIRGSAKVEDASLAEAKARVERITAHAPQIAANMKKAGVELHLVARGEKISDLPEFQPYRGWIERQSGATFDQRYHGGRASGTIVACTEENLFKDKTDPYPPGYDVCTHETTHAVFDFGLDAALRRQVQQRYAAALQEGKYEGEYAARDVTEFFAELTGKYFAPDHGGLDRSDPATFALLDAIYSGRSAPSSIAVQTLKPVPSSSVSRPIDVQSGVEIANHSSASLREGWALAGGQVDTTRTDREIPPGARDAVGARAGDVVALVDASTKAIVVRVAVGQNWGRVTVTDAMVKAESPSDSVPFLAPLPIAALTGSASAGATPAF